MISDVQELTQLIEELSQLKEKHVDSSIRWYQKHSKLPRALFRITGYLLIILSVSIPFVTTFNGSKVFLSVIALFIAILSGINSFQQWDSKWRIYKQAQFTLETLNATWELQIVEARQMERVEDAIKLIIEATRSLLEKSRAEVILETEKYFQNIKIPQVAVKKD